MASEDRLDERTWQELRSIIDEEIARLPDKYQAPLVLCHLEGKSHNRAAKELGCAKTTLERRLCRGRELLRQLFVKRGITLSTGVLATVLSDKVAGAPLSALLTANTVKAAACVISGKTLIGVCLTARALALAEEAMVGMVAVKAKLIVLVMTFGLVIGGASWAGFGGGGEKSQAVLVGIEQPPSDKDKMQQTGKKPLVTTDLYGDPLPEGALARLGPQRFRHEGEAAGLSFTPNGKTLLGQTKSGVILWDAATGRELRRLPAPFEYSGINAMGISPDGKTLAITEIVRDDQTNTGDNQKISIWELDSGKKKRTLSFPIGPTGYGVHVPTRNRLFFTPDGKGLMCLAGLGENGRKAFLLDVASGQVRLTLGSDDSGFYDHALSSDGKTLATVGYRKRLPTVELVARGIKLWDIGTGKLVRELPAEHVGGVRSLAFSPDGKMLAIRASRILVFDVATGKNLGEFESEAGNDGVAFTSDGKKLA